VPNRNGLMHNEAALNVLLYMEMVSGIDGIYGPILQYFCYQAYIESDAYFCRSENDDDYNDDEQSVIQDIPSFISEADDEIKVPILKNGAAQIRKDLIDNEVEWLNAWTNGDLTAVFRFDQDELKLTLAFPNVNFGADSPNETTGKVVSVVVTVTAVSYWCWDISATAMCDVDEVDGTVVEYYKAIRNLKS
jgi:hypothetical protein